MNYVAEKPFLVFLDAPCEVDTMEPIKSYFRRILMQVHSDKSKDGENACSDQGKSLVSHSISLLNYLN
jgi:hypothetical protein